MELDYVLITWLSCDLLGFLIFFLPGGMLIRFISLPAALLCQWWDQFVSLLPLGARMIVRSSCDHHMTWSFQLMNSFPLKKRAAHLQRLARIAPLTAQKTSLRWSWSSCNRIWKRTDTQGIATTHTSEFHYIISTHKTWCLRGVAACN